MPAARWSPKASKAHGLFLGRRRRYSVRPFLLTLLAILAITVLSFAKESARSGTQHGALHRRGLLALEAHEDQECRLVHKAKDKCAFVRANCPDEEAGILSYLTLYFCQLPNAQPLAFITMVLWLALLFSTIGIAASDFFCVNLSTISNFLGMSESMAGVTFLAFGNGSPDVFSTFVAMSTNSGSLALGELIGAAGFITAVVAGSMALVRPFKVARKSFIRDICFFIFAASFSMTFLYDGKLYLWECITMVCFYIFYVAFVVFWHWWLNRRRQRRLKEAAERSHYVMPGGEEEEVDGEDHEEDDRDTGGRLPSIREPSAEDLSLLERGDDSSEIDEDEAEQEQERWLSELSSNMRLSRPRISERRNTQTAIRPSLVGALEFRAVLASLKKSRNIQTIPIGLRRYSDDPNFTTGQQQDRMSTISDPAARPPYQIRAQRSSGSLQVPNRHLDASVNRQRAVSANDADRLRFDPRKLQRDAAPNVDLLGPLHEDVDGSKLHDPFQKSPSPSISLSPLSSLHGSRDASPAPAQVRVPSPDRLAPPEASPHVLLSPELSPHPSPRTRPSPKLSIPDSDTTAFPSYTDQPPSARSSRAPSLLLPPPSASPESYFPPDRFLQEEEDKPLRWWPYRFLPPPRVLVSTLFPTLYSWHDKNLWEKFLGIVAAPSVFLLTITLPVVEIEKEQEEEHADIPTINLSQPASPVVEGRKRSRSGHITIFEPPRPPHTDGHSMGGTSYHSAYSKGFAGHGSTASISAGAESNHREHYHSQILSPDSRRFQQSPEQLPTQHPHNPPSPREWNRWLVIVQTFTAPFFIALIVWANTSPSSPRALVRPMLYSLLASLVTLALIVTTTAPTRPPRWRILLCFLGFAVSIAWISTIAGEVVGVLKTLGVVLNMSDAILGLTVFAVGNSLGDLVADITVARLGYPVMALSACFGGPMLNILLGIGLSGGYITVRGARRKHRKHPDDPMHFRPYHVDVSGTLIISGATLLATLIGLLVMVPLRKWRMDRVVGCCLVAVWVCSTIGNVVAEVLGWGGETH